MMEYRYKIKPLAQRKIRSFYYNVAKKYRHTYSKWLMHKNIDDAVDAMFQIENGLLRREPTISQWAGYRSEYSCMKTEHGVLLIQMSIKLKINLSR